MMETTRFHYPLCKKEEDAKLNILNEYCKSYLAFIIDEGYEVRVGYIASTRQCIVNGLPRYKITIDNIRNSGLLINLNPFSFSDISDTVIPFIYQINEEYGIHSNIKFRQYSNLMGPSPIYEFDVNSILEGNIKVYNIVDIEIDIKISQSYLDIEIDKETGKVIENGG